MIALGKEIILKLLVERIKDLLASNYAKCAPMCYLVCKNFEGILFHKSVRYQKQSLMILVNATSFPYIAGTPSDPVGRSPGVPTNPFMPSADPSGAKIEP